MDITAYRLRELREKRGLSQREVAEQLGITRTAYNKYEAGSIKPVRKLEELSNLFGVSADFLLGKDMSAVEREIKEQDAAPRTQGQVRKYLRLSDTGREMVDILLDAIYERERRGHDNKHDNQ